MPEPVLCPERNRQTPEPRVQIRTRAPADDPHLQPAAPGECIEQREHVVVGHCQFGRVGDHHQGSVVVQKQTNITRLVVRSSAYHSVVRDVTGHCVVRLPAVEHAPSHDAQYCELRLMCRIGLRAVGAGAERGWRVAIRRPMQVATTWRWKKGRPPYATHTDCSRYHLVDSRHHVDT